MLLIYDGSVMMQKYTREVTHIPPSMVRVLRFSFVNKRLLAARIHTKSKIQKYKDLVVTFLFLALCFYCYPLFCLVADCSV